MTAMHGIETVASALIAPSISFIEAIYTEQRNFYRFIRDKLNIKLHVAYKVRLYIIVTEN